MLSLLFFSPPAGHTLDYHSGNNGRPSPLRAKRACPSREAARKNSGVRKFNQFACFAFASTLACVSNSTWGWIIYGKKGVELKGADIEDWTCSGWALVRKYWNLCAPGSCVRAASADRTLDFRIAKRMCSRRCIWCIYFWRRRNNNLASACQCWLTTGRCCSADSVCAI